MVFGGTVMDQIEEYCEHMLATGRKKSSVRVYRVMLRTCIETLADEGMETDARKISETEIYYLVGHLDMSEATAKAYIMTLNGMIEFYTGSNLVKRMRILWNRPNRHRVFITTDDFARMYSAADIRGKTVLVLGAFMGLRRQEMQQIKLTDIRRDHIIIHGKGHGKNGLVVCQPMPIEVREIIDRYIRWRSSLPGTDCSDDRLIVYYDKDTDEIRHYYDDGGALSMMVKRLGKSVGVDATCHSLRRLFCTNLYYGVDGEGGCDLATLKDLMRHATITTTMECYINVRDREKDETIRKYGASLGRVLNI